MLDFSSSPIALQRFYPKDLDKTVLNAHYRYFTKLIILKLKSKSKINSKFTKINHQHVRYNKFQIQNSWNNVAFQGQMGD